MRRQRAVSTTLPIWQRQVQVCAPPTPFFPLDPRPITRLKTFVPPRLYMYILLFNASLVNLGFFFLRRKNIKKVL
jgi:hypothetical protein